MSEFDDEIRARLNEHREQVEEQAIWEEQRRAREAFLAANPPGEPPEVIADRNQVLSLCAEFAVWATDNDIQQNCPSIFASGWLLGTRSGPPFKAIYDVGGSFSASRSVFSHDRASERKLLVGDTGDVSELVTVNAFIPRWDYKTPVFAPLVRKLSYKANDSEPEKYSISGIQDAIFEFARDNHKDW